MLLIHSIKKTICISAIVLAVLLTGGGEIFAQKGHGKGRDHDRGHRKERGNSNGHGKGQNWDGWESKRERKADDWNARRQQQINDWNTRRQQKVNDWNAKRQQQIVEWNMRRQQQWNDRDARRQQKMYERNARRQQNWYEKRWLDDDDRRERRRNRQQVYYAPVQIFPNVWNGRQWGQQHAAENRYRRDMRRAWKEERKAQRRYEKEQRKYARLRDREYRDNYYYGDNHYVIDDYRYDDYRYDDGPNWKEQLLRTVIGSFLNGNFDGNGLNVLDRFDDRQVIGRSYREPVPAYYNSPIYVGYSPTGGYYDQSGYDYQDVGFDDLADGNGLDLGGLLGQLPIEDLISNYAGDGFVAELLGNLLTQGYDQGFLAGQAARENGYGDRYFNDPYSIGGVFDPYSTAIGDNREILSSGYALGYRDALNGREDYDPLSEGNTDLVSLLLSNVLGAF